MNLQDLNELDFNNMGGWPAPVKAVAVLLLCAITLGAGYYVDTQNQLLELEGHRNKEQELRQTFERKQSQAASLEPLKRQLEEMNQSFGALLRLLPNRTEIEGLLVDISQAGLASGLEFELFQPGGEQKEEFIAVLPITIAVTGTYHQFGEFISAVSALPRIVTQHDITMVPVGKAGESPTSGLLLKMDMVAKTYRYLEEDEIAQ